MGRHSGSRSRTGDPDQALPVKPALPGRQAAVPGQLLGRGRRAAGLPDSELLRDRLSGNCDAAGRVRVSERRVRLNPTAMNVTVTRTRWTFSRRRMCSCLKLKTRAEVRTPGTRIISASESRLGCTGKLSSNSLGFRVPKPAGPRPETRLAGHS